MQGMLVGSFRLVGGSSSGVKTLNCPTSLPDFDGSVASAEGSVEEANTVTHTNNLEKRVVAFDWIPPRGFQGEVYFK